MPRVSEMPRPGPLTGLELIPGLQGAGPAGNVGMPLLLTGAPSIRDVLLFPTMKPLE